MNEKIYRCYVEKKHGFDVAAKALEGELSELFHLPLKIRIFNRYDIQNLQEKHLQEVINTVLSEPMSDVYFKEELPNFENDVRLLLIEPLPGQYDVRADSCEQCIQLLLGSDRPVVRTAKVYAISGTDDTTFPQIKSYLINPLESREASSEKPATLLRKSAATSHQIPEIADFIRINLDRLEEIREELGLAMSFDDIKMLQAYFKSEGRNPTLTELRVIDTYWSDHCRHTTFNTIIDTVDIADPRVEKAYELFLSVKGEKQVTLMNIATAAMKHLRKNGDLPMLDVSEENNACTIRVTAKFDGGDEDWLLFFKNETHNHPTEIEPFGGASTCIGGAIRDPLSGRAYVYQAMRITGSGDPRESIDKTLQGKLPQKKITTTAAEGYSSYGNQIGIATGYVKEIYHQGYVAKRMEVGAVVGAAPLAWVKRERPAPGDIVALLGGRTGRDGIGGATGSSKTHGMDTVSDCASEVQKGNAPEERKLQRLFRNPEVTRLIKRCNDFGAGGVSVAIGELADGVAVNLDAVPTKYEGLDGTELAISESQERMAVVIAEGDLAGLLKFAETENVEASVVAEITQEKRLVMLWHGTKIVDISREFLDTNGAERYAAAKVQAPAVLSQPPVKSFEQGILALAADLNFCSQKGLVERFDSTIGAGSVLVPFGGKHALTETQVMAALFPKVGAKTASVMAHGFDPYFTNADPFAGSAYAVVTSVAKLVAAGAAVDTIHLSLQEYFPQLHNDPTRWGQPFSAMLGAFSAQMGLGLAAIGGKDSMSGSFGELDVPSTLISFAAATADAKRIISPEFKAVGNPVYLLETPLDKDDLPDYTALKSLWEQYGELLGGGKVLSAWCCEAGGISGGILKMALGNMIGFKFASSENSTDKLFGRQWGSIIFEATEEIPGFRLLGHTGGEQTIAFGEDSVSLGKLASLWIAPLEGVFPTKVKQTGEVPKVTDTRPSALHKGTTFTRPKAVIPVFPGTNCEYDTVSAIERAGGRCEVVLVRNLTPTMLRESVTALENAIASAQMLVFPGGFSGGDEPDGSGKFIVSLFRNQRLTEAVHDLLYSRDGLALGICNGFQALIKLGLLPHGKIGTMTPHCPTLAHNHIGRHQARYVNTRVSSVLSPWLSKCKVGEVYTQPISHGEGRFAASPQVLDGLRENGQIAFQYVDDQGEPTMDIAHNPNGSDWATEGICSPDGRVLGKMAHTERVGDYVAKNIAGNKFLPLFEGGVDYFR